MSLSAKITTRSGRSIRQTLNKFAKSVQKAGEREILREAQEIFSASQSVVPFKTGALQGTGYVQGPVRKGSTSSVFVIYGGQGVDYALVRHETEARAYTTPGTRHKYLTNPFTGFKSFKQGMSKRVESGIRKRIGSRGISVR